MENMIFDAERVCYKLNMPVNTEKKSETILVNISPSVYNLVAQIAKTEDRKMGYVARELMMRGLSRYELDGKLRDEATPAIRTAEVHLAPVVATITPAVDPKDEVRRMIGNEDIEQIQKRVGQRKIPVLKQKAK